MKISDLIAMCLRNLTRRKFRTFLTVMGVVIGTCSIVVMISLGVGISVSQEEMLNSIGDLTVIEVYNWNNTGDTLLDDETIATIQAMPDVEIVTPFMRLDLQDGYMQMYGGKKRRYVSGYTIYGVYPEALELMGNGIVDGTNITSTGGKRLQILFGSDFAYTFEDTKKRWPNNMVDSWPDEEGNIPDPFFNPMDTELTFVLNYYGDTTPKEMEYFGDVVGILEGSSWEFRRGAFMHLDDMKRLRDLYNKQYGIKKDRTKPDQYEDVRVKVNNVKNVSAVQSVIKDEMGFDCWSWDSVRENLQESAQQTQLILAILGGVSLFVSAISITNTMIMSVYERTREIGVMKVLGCLVGDVRSVFLMEAGLIGLIGGIVGIGFSYLLSFLLNTFGDRLGNFLGGMGGGYGAQVSIIPVWLAVLGLGFATCIGLISGFQPANRAVKISALEAIKTE